MKPILADLRRSSSCPGNSLPAILAAHQRYGCRNFLVDAHIFKPADGGSSRILLYPAEIEAYRHLEGSTMPLWMEDYGTPLELPSPQLLLIIMPNIHDDWVLWVTLQVENSEMTELAALVSQEQGGGGHNLVLVLPKVTVIPKGFPFQTCALAADATYILADRFESIQEMVRKPRRILSRTFPPISDYKLTSLP